MRDIKKKNYRVVASRHTLSPYHRAESLPVSMADECVEAFVTHKTLHTSAISFAYLRYNY